MNLDASGIEDYYETARQIFDYYIADSSGTLRVDSLMDKFAPFVKTNKAEYDQLKSFLDPDHVNPEMNVTMLANALHKYSDSQKCKVDLEESFNLKTGQGPQDSDSGISTDGFQLLEELQCELKEKAHLAHQLRSQLDFTDRQHEEAIAALTAERDSIRAHLNMLREENKSLSGVRRDYEEASERLCASDRALAAAHKDLDALQRRYQLLQDRHATLEHEKSTLQDQLSQSAAECHRINEMYAARQSALLERSEALRTDHAGLLARLHDQGELVHQLNKDKVLLEMELKDLLNKSNQTQQHFDRSIEVSYTEDQMLTALDSLNADSRFTHDTATQCIQAEFPCLECDKRNAAVPHRSLRKLFWEAVKCLFQVFAVVCFVGAVCTLYGVSRRAGRCARTAVPWRWLDAQEFMDLLLRIEYVADVPM